MKYCRSKDVRSLHIFTLSLLAVCAVMHGGYAWRFMQTRTGIGYVWLFIFVISFYLLVFTMFAVWLIWKLRKYRLDKDGITVAYFQAFPRKIPWDAVSEVAVCRVHYSTRSGWETAIRVVVWAEYGGPSKGDGPWSYEQYSLFNHRRIIIINYTEEKLQEFIDLCPLTVVDYR